MEVLAESELDLTLVNLLAEETGGEHEVVANFRVVDIQQVFVFVAHGESTG